MNTVGLGFAYRFKLNNNFNSNNWMPNLRSARKMHNLFIYFVKIV